MKGNRELDDLLIAYLLKELNAEEEAFVVEYIQADERNERHFEELRNTWKVAAIQKGLERVDVNDEWGQFEQTIVREQQELRTVRTEITPEEDKIPEFEKTRGRSKTAQLLIVLAVAASVLGVFVLGRELLKGKEPAPYQISEKAAIKKDSAVSVMRREVNTSGKPRKLVLSDGSEIVLADKSEVSYSDPFISNKRSILLRGKANFKVAKDKTRPFTVYSLDLATTALGTQFTVSAFEDKENTIIQMEEGKVVVKTAVHGKAKFGQEYYLYPGQDLVYNNRNYTTRLIDHHDKGSVAENSRGKEMGKDSPDLPDDKKGSWYMFNNQSLAQVFDQLMVLYSVDINYSKRDVYNLYFAGRFDKSDSLYTILNQIASLNNLKVAQKNNGFKITKK